MPPTRRNHLLWIGPAVAFAGAVSYFVSPTVLVPALRDFPWVQLPLVLAGLGLSALGLWRQWGVAGTAGKVLGGIGALFALVVASAFVLYVFVISSWLPPPTAATLALAAAPELALPDQNGRTVTLGDLAGRKVVLVFYRGHW